jgi:hypothetical protein
MVFQGQDADTVQGRALVNGTVAYVAMIDTSNCSNPPFNTSCTNQIVRIDVSSLAPAEGVIMAQEMTTGLQLLGISGGNLFYEFTDGSQLNVITTSASGTNPGSPVFAASGGSTLDLSTLQMPAPLPLPVVVAGGVYYTVYTPSAPGVPYLRAWFSNGTSHTAIGSFSMVLGGVLASPIPTSFASLVANPTSSTNAVVPIYGSALIATMPPGNAAKETPPLPGDVFPGTTIASYDGNGALSATLGQLYASLVSDEYDGVTISPGAMQEGMPALLYVSGYSTQTSYIGHDLYKITPGTANSLIQVTNNLQ